MSPRQRIYVMRDHDDVPYIVIERQNAGLGPFLWGALIGAVAGLLLAPRAGSETQEEIRRGVRRVRTAAEDGIDSARTSVERTRGRIDGGIGAVRERIDSVRDRIDALGDRSSEGIEGGPGRDVRDVERQVSDVRDTEAGVGPGGVSARRTPSSSPAMGRGYVAPSADPFEGPMDQA